MIARMQWAMLMMLACGCQTVVTPPSFATDPVDVYLTDYGRHSSIVLPEPTGGYDEFAFGDWDFFAGGDTRWWVAMRAVLCSPQATLGRRRVEAQPSDTAMQAALGVDRIARFTVARVRAEALREDLQATFRRSNQPAYLSRYSMLEHVRDTELYCGLRNCNHVTADWLRRLGCRVEGPAIWSNFVVRRPEREW